MSVPVSVSCRHVLARGSSPTVSMFCNSTPMKNANSTSNAKAFRRPLHNIIDNIAYHSCLGLCMHQWGNILFNAMRMRIEETRSTSNQVRGASEVEITISEQQKQIIRINEKRTSIISIKHHCKYEKSLFQPPLGRIYGQCQCSTQWGKQGRKVNEVMTSQ